ncbi:hypothetical protein MTR67_003038 [Solanum verrucosum]|uniref:Gag-pol polyprotein n=1 Tax=Solanum verrucosum TaxID=315347 RepID=A0AAF0TA04_SOLVR|nr:hypothetical protein MTR67_003038 [Solanum verrucosum]
MKEGELPCKGGESLWNSNAHSPKVASGEQIHGQGRHMVQAMKTQANREVIAPLNLNVGTTATRTRNFTRMNSPEFHGSKTDKDPQELIDEVYKIVGIMGSYMVEKVELDAYQLKGVA